MSHYIGIDLGTTNSAIASFDGTEVRLFKSPEQHDVTPSAIAYDRRGNKFVGFRAYKRAAQDPGSAAIGFKRLMGTSTPIQLPSINRTMTPEECSAELLRVLHGFLPEELRNAPDTGTVITVPAAFNQMQKDATRAAGDLAGIPRLALMQEPVAAIMSVMRKERADGIFTVYDLGGGTLDIAVAQSVGGRVELLGHGGIEMCGGRDFDRTVFDQVVLPWLLKNFDLPEDLKHRDEYRGLQRMATWAAEAAKIELSSLESVSIALTEDEIGVKDRAGTDLYLQVPLSRSVFNALIEQRVRQSVGATRDAMRHAGISPGDVSFIVFVGGPTQYKPLRDLVTGELGVPASTDVNPMTAVAEGAAVFAETVDWSSPQRHSKPIVGGFSTEGPIPILLNFQARTPAANAQVAVSIDGGSEGCEMEIVSRRSGWSSGRVMVKGTAHIAVPLEQLGENHFSVSVFDAAGRPVKLATSDFVVRRTAAAIEAIPASSSIGVEVLEQIGGRPTLEYLVRKGDPLPKKGIKRFFALDALRSGDAASLNFKLWEGEVTEDVTDNRLIGMFTISGRDFDEGLIAQGDELLCEYEVHESGTIVLDVKVKAVAGRFRKDNFYSRQGGAVDYAAAASRVRADAEETEKRVMEVASIVEDPQLDAALQRVQGAMKISDSEVDPETAKEAQDGVLEAKRLLAEVRRQHASRIRSLELDKAIRNFAEYAKPHARPTEITAFDALAQTARLCVDRPTAEFESHLEDLQSRTWGIMLRDVGFLTALLAQESAAGDNYPDRTSWASLIREGSEALEKRDVDRARAVLFRLWSLRPGSASDRDLAAVTNIIRG